MLRPYRLSFQVVTLRLFKPRHRIFAHFQRTHKPVPSSCRVSGSTRHDVTGHGSMTPEHIIVTRHDGYVATVQLNRPKVLNALNLALMIELVDALEELDSDPDVRCIVLHGSER